MISFQQFRLDAKNHKLVYGILSALAVLLFVLTPLNPVFAMSSVTNFKPLPDVTMADTSWGTGPLSNDYLRSHQDAWGQNPGTVSSTMPLALAVLASHGQIQATVSGVTTTVCKFDRYTFVWGSYMRWITDANGVHHLQRTVGYDQSNVAIPGFMGSGFSAASKWPYHDDTLSSQDTFMYMNTQATGHVESQGVSGWDQGACESNLSASGFHGIKRFNGTPVTPMTWTDVMSTWDDTGDYTGSSGYYGIVYQANVSYDASYTGRKNFNLTPPQGQPASGCNESTGLVQFAACKIAEAIGGVLDPIWNGIISLFVPDSQKVSDLVGATGTFFQEKLGFLLYPFDFVIDMFGVFTSPPTSWCNSSTCVVDAGNVFGGDLRINLYAMKDMFPPLWTLLLTIARIGLVLALISGIHRKFEEVTQK